MDILRKPNLTQFACERSHPEPLTGGRCPTMQQRYTNIIFTRLMSSRLHLYFAVATVRRFIIRLRTRRVFVVSKTPLPAIGNAIVLTISNFNLDIVSDGDLTNRLAAFYYYIQGE